MMGEPEMCMEPATGAIAAMALPDPETGLLRTPWCHLPKGHDGPHVCGEFRWVSEQKKKITKDEV